MKSPTDRNIAIVGTGIAGLALAYRLLPKGYRLTLIAESKEGSCASHCAQGVLANKGLIFFESPLFAAKLQSLPHTQTWLDEIEVTSGKAIERNFGGVYEPYWNEEDFSSLSTRIYRNRFWGCHGTKNFKKIGGPFPFASKQALGYLFYPRDGWFNVVQALQALETILRRAGVRFIDRKVHCLKPSGRGPISAISDAWEESFDTIILASGAGTPAILESSGVIPPKMFAIGGQTLAVPVPMSSETPRTAVRQLLSATWSKQTLFLGSISWKGAEIDSSTLAENRRQLSESVQSQFGWNLEPWIGEARSRVGTRIRFADRMPAIGTLPSAPWSGKLYLMMGFYKSGLQLADLAAKDLTLLLEGRSQDRQFIDFDSLRIFKS